MSVGQRVPTHVAHKLITEILLPSGALLGCSSVSRFFASAFSQLPTEEASATLGHLASPYRPAAGAPPAPDVSKYLRGCGSPGPAAAPGARAGSAVNEVRLAASHLPPSSQHSGAATASAHEYPIVP